MSEVKHDGCFDCGSTTDAVLTSLTCTRAMGKKNVMTYGSFALCSTCAKEEEARKNV